MFGCRGFLSAHPPRQPSMTKKKKKKNLGPKMAVAAPPLRHHFVLCLRFWTGHLMALPGPWLASVTVGPSRRCYHAQGPAATGRRAGPSPAVPNRRTNLPPVHPYNHPHRHHCFQSGWAGGSFLCPGKGAWALAINHSMIERERTQGLWCGSDLK